jgi:hypothetical protein
MSGRQLGIVTIVMAAVVVLGGPQPACLHGENESSDQATRRQQALRLARQINTMESRAHAQTRTYQPLQQLSLTEGVPQGFVMHLATDGTAYAFSVKDTTDACRFGYFSDQDGLIFVGQALR